MGKKKVEQKNKFEWMNRPDTPDTTALRSLIQNVDYTTPIVNNYGQLEKQIGNEYYADDLPDEAINRIKQGKIFNMKMQKGADLANAKNSEHQYKTASLASLSAGMQPQLIQTGGTTTQSGDLLGGLLGFAPSLGNLAGNAFASWGQNSGGTPPQGRPFAS